MIKIVPKKLPEYLRKAVGEAIPMAEEFVSFKYGHTVFNDVILLIRPGARKGKYYPNNPVPHKIYGHTPVAQVDCHDKLYLYVKNSLGKYKQGLPVGYTIAIASCAIHELTHHVQFKQDRGYSELETTGNELEFIRVKFPDWYKLLMIEMNGAN